MVSVRILITEKINFAKYKRNRYTKNDASVFL